jgi:hypothetical protein
LANFEVCDIFSRYFAKLRHVGCNYMKDIFLNEIQKQKEFEHKQFIEWIKSIFQLKELLQLDYNQIYQDCFYIKIFEFITVGTDYVELLYKTFEQKDHSKSAKYRDLLNTINEIKSSFTDAEMEFIEFRRHCSSHIFTKGYNFIKDDLKIKKEIKGKRILDIHENFGQILKKHKSKENFDKYFNSKVFICLNKINFKI